MLDKSNIIHDIGFLRQKSLPIESVQEAREIIGKLKEAIDGLDNGLGLAAIQIGIPKRVGIIKIGEEYNYLINPVLKEAKEELIYHNEGCLSFPKEFIDTKRYQQYIITNQTLVDDAANEFKEEIQYYYFSPDATEPGNCGVGAICVQHEMDHFDGILFTDKKAEFQPIERKNKKIGRNDTCPCGSKKKFKKCCIGNGKFD